MKVLETLSEFKLGFVFFFLENRTFLIKPALKQRHSSLNWMWKLWIEKTNMGWSDSFTTNLFQKTLNSGWTWKCIVSVVGVAVCVEQTGSALRDPEEGGGPSNSLTVSAGQPESDAELPQPAREWERSHLPGGERAHHEPISGSPCCQLKPRSPTPLTGRCIPPQQPWNFTSCISHSSGFPKFFYCHKNFNIQGWNAYKCRHDTFIIIRPKTCICCLFLNDCCFWWNDLIKPKWTS